MFLLDFLQVVEEEKNSPFECSTSGERTENLFFDFLIRAYNSFNQSGTKTTVLHLI